MKKLPKLSLLIAAAVMLAGLWAGNQKFTASASAVYSTLQFSVDIPEKVVLGDTVSLPAGIGAVVFDPTGREISYTGNSFIARLAGYYAIDFFGPDNFYYSGCKVLSEALEGELKIAGATAPTVKLYESPVNQNIPFGGFADISQNESRRVKLRAVIELDRIDEYIGYELIVHKDGEKIYNGTAYTGAGNLIPTAVRSIYKEIGGKSRLELEIEFTAEAGVNTFVFRGMDAGGKSAFVYDTFNVEGTSIGPGPNPLASKVVVPTEIELGMPYNMPVSEENYEEYYTGMKIFGYQYEMKGNIITPKTLQGGWYFGYYWQDKTDPNNVQEGDGGNFTITDKVSPVFMLYDKVPAYAEKLENTDYYSQLMSGKPEAELAPIYFVRIPEISVIDAGGVKTFNVIVKDRLGDAQRVEYYNGVGYFRPLVDGKYTVTYEAADQAGNISAYTVTIPVGKLTAPSLTINGTHPSDVKQGWNFSYLPVTVSDLTQDLTDRVRVTKTLYAPDGTVVPGSVETALNASDMTYKLEIIGTYKAFYEAADDAGNKTVKEFSITVSEAGKADTLTTLNIGGATVYGNAATLTAIVTSAAGTPSGTVSFYDGEVLLGTAALDTEGKATFATTVLSVGIHTITAVYEGDDNFNASTSVSGEKIVTKASGCNSAFGFTDGSGLALLVFMLIAPACLLLKRKFFGLRKI